MSGRRIVSPRSTWGWVAVACAGALASAGALAATGTGHNPYYGAVLGAVAAVLAVLALPSIPTRTSAALILALGGVVVVRHVRRPGSGLVLVGTWAFATLLALVLIDRADLDERPRLTRGSSLPRLGREIASATSLLVVAVLLVGALLAPALGHRPPPRLGAGDLPRYDLSGGSGSSLAQNDSLDTTVRPHLGDEVVMTVTAARPQFWRGETFDHWSGSTWTRSIDDRTTLPTVGNLSSVIPPIGTPEAGGRMLAQTFRIEAPYADVIFAAAEPVQVEAGRLPVERPDGTLSTNVAFGQGSTYRVVSRVPDATADTLRASEGQPVPAAIRDIYAQQPIATHRVRLLAQQVTKDQPTTYDKVRALEAWMGAHTKYSLKAPIAHRGVDVVDDFLFNVQQGWCEQISSSLVVMLRTLGIPAREATGFVPGEASRLSDEWTVRAKDAHAWAEVFFPGVGWQAFDPTADVALAGESKGTESLWGWIGGHVLGFGLLLVAIALVLAAGTALASFVRRRRELRARSWAARRLADLERLGAGAGRARDPAETVAEYASAVAAALDARDLVAVGTAIEADAFSPDGIDASARAEAEARLGAARSRAADGARHRLRFARG